MYCNLECTWDVYLKEAHGRTVMLGQNQITACGGNGQYCEDIKLTCSRPYGEFPNSCSGELQYGVKQIGLFAYRTESETGQSEVVLESKILGHFYERKSQICTGSFNVTWGSCLGLNPHSVGLVTNLPAEAPPDAPPSNGYHFPHVGPTTTETTMTRTTNTRTTSTKTSTTLTSTSATTTITTVSSTTVSTVTMTTTTMVPSTLSGSVLPWFLGVASVLAVGGYLYNIRRSWVALQELELSYHNMGT